MKYKKWIPRREFNTCPNCKHMLGDVWLLTEDMKETTETEINVRIGLGKMAPEDILRKDVCPRCDRNADGLQDVDWSLADKP